jgi:hypothetical protein
MSATVNGPPNELHRLIAAEKTAARIPERSRARVWEDLEASLLLPPPSTSRRVRQALRRAAVSRTTSVLIGAAVGGAGGMALQARLDRSISHQTQVVALPIAAPPPSMPSAAPEPIATPAPRAPLSASKPATHKTERLPASSPPAATSAPPLEQPSALEQERNALDTARTALARGDAQGALRLLAGHARDYPNGAFAEERAALRIQALAISGADAQAHKSLEEFRVKYPKSLMLPAIEESLKPSP